MKTRILIIAILAAGSLAFADTAMADDVDFNKPHKASDHPNPNVCCNYSHRDDEMTSSVVPRTGPGFEPGFEYEDIFEAGDEPDDDAPLSPHDAAAAAAKKASDAARAQVEAARAAAKAEEAAADVVMNAAAAAAKAAAATAENAAAHEPSETSRNDARRTDKSQQAARAAMLGARVAQIQRRAGQAHVPRHHQPRPQPHTRVLRIEVRR